MQGLYFLYITNECQYCRILKCITGPLYIVTAATANHDAILQLLKLLLVHTQLAA